MDDIFEKTLLFDIYGELLTEKQRELYSLYYLRDYSLSEISQLKGISRQGVRDSVKKCYEHFVEYEKKLKVMKRYLDISSRVDKMIEALESADYDKKTAITLAKEIKESL